MSIGDAIYQSVRLVCCTVLLIALLHFALPVAQLWALYSLRKSEQREFHPQIFRTPIPSQIPETL